MNSAWPKENIQDVGFGLNAQQSQNLGPRTEDEFSHSQLVLPGVSFIIEAHTRKATRCPCVCVPPCNFI